MSIESPGYQPNESEAHRPDSESLTQEQRDSLPLVEMAHDDDVILGTRENKVHVSDILRFKGVPVDSGHVRFRMPDGQEIIVTTEREYYGGLVE